MKSASVPKSCPRRETQLPVGQVVLHSQLVAAKDQDVDVPMGACVSAHEDVHCPPAGYPPRNGMPAKTSAASSTKIGDQL